MKENPFITQQELADRLQLSRSAVAGYISTLMKEGMITGRAYILPDQKTITCIGGANLDRKIHAIGSLQYGTSNPASTTYSYGGVARNVAENLGRMGVSPTFITIVGQDTEGRTIVEHCRETGIDVSRVYTVDNANTGTYTAVLDEEGNLVMAFADMKIYDALTVETIDERWPVIASSDIVVADTNLPEESLCYLIERCESEKLLLCIVPVSVPKAERLPDDLNGVYLLIANRDELAAISSLSVDTNWEIETACQALIDRGCRNTIVTLGERGVYHASKSGEHGWTPALPTEVVDVTGAGDAFTAGVIYVLRKNKQDIDRACRVGVQLASLTLTSEETVYPNLNEQLIERWMLQ